MRLVEAFGRDYVPFEVQTQEQEDLRDMLREQLRALEPEPGNLLYARLSGPLRGGVDIENALFYNLDAKGVFRSMENGVVFERDPASHAGSFHYQYTMSPDVRSESLRRLPERLLNSLKPNLLNRPSEFTIAFQKRQRAKICRGFTRLEQLRSRGQS